MVPKGVFDTRVEGFIPSHYHLDMKHGWLGKQVHGQLSYVQKGSKGIKRDQQGSKGIKRDQKGSKGIKRDQ